MEKNIVDELKLEKKLIEDPETPVRSYNYSFIRDRIVNDYHQKLSLSTIISRANDMGYCIKWLNKKYISFLLILIKSGL